MQARKFTAKTASPTPYGQEMKTSPRSKATTGLRIQATKSSRANTKQHLAANRRIHDESEGPHHRHCRALERDIKPRRPQMPQHAMPRLPKRADELQSKAHKFTVKTASPTTYGLKIESKSTLKRNHRFACLGNKIVPR